ncbi:MAG TPA: rhamnogalacturonan acetylesterase [Opitutaceae bacterium]|nr:rhamnogalacturonan acetylesterase [Opitutaceae bacterium]
MPSSPSLAVAALALLSLAAATPQTQNAAPDLAPQLTIAPVAPPAPANPKLPAIWVAGDSTAARGAGDAQQGWGVLLADYFDPAKMNVVNCARGGRSSRTFITEGLWGQLVAGIRPGDIVLIQFGINDAGALNDEPPPPLRARGSIPGLGDETKEIDNVITKRHEVVHTYGWYMRKMVADVKDKGAKPVVLSTTVRNIWKDGRIERGAGRYGAWAAQVAKEADVPFIDVANLVADQLEPMGQDKVKALYPRDHTHFNAAGADLHAAAVLAGLKGLPRSPIAGTLSAKGETVAADRTGWLRLPRPADPSLPTLFLIGDSTVRNGRGDGANNQLGWGEPVVAYFDPGKINVVNRAVGGLSSRTYLTQGHWARVLAMLRRGDFVMMQFGRNDGSAVNDTSRARGTIKGVGAEIQEIDNLLTKKPETVFTFGHYLRVFVEEARAKGATPIVCSLVPQKIWKDGKILREKDSYAGWAGQVAEAEGAPFLDLNELAARRYDELGPQKVEALFGDPHTHTSPAGAEVNAECVVAALKALRDDPLALYFSGKAGGVPPAAP